GLELARAEIAVGLARVTAGGGTEEREIDGLGFAPRAPIFAEGMAEAVRVDVFVMAMRIEPEGRGGGDLRGRGGGAAAVEIDLVGPRLFVGRCDEPRNIGRAAGDRIRVEESEFLLRLVGHRLAFEKGPPAIGAVAAATGPRQE